MSIAAIRFAYGFPDLTSSEKLVLLYLADRAGKTGHCFPSQNYLCDRTGLCKRTVRSSLVALTEKGAIKRSKRNNADGTRTSDDYLILHPRPAAIDAATPRQNSTTIPTSPYGVGKGKKKGGYREGALGLRLVHSAEVSNG